MLVSVSWLKKYVDFDADTSTLARDLTMIGVKVERVHRHGIDDDKIVIGLVRLAEAHPNADRLRRCEVDVGGEETLQIVCGAANVAAGQRVPVALVGAQLPNGLKIRKSKIRGVVSHGMICSASELGLGDDAEGIMVLDGEPVVGAPASTVIGAGADVLELEVTPNRPDQLCHYGVAREIAAMYDLPLAPLTPPEHASTSSSDGITVDIEDDGDCFRFVARVVRGVKVGPSPAWLRDALDTIGLKSINNIVDVTNFVMMETGQPMHAYDLKRLSGRLGVRRARPEEQIQALDDATYACELHYLLITDDDTPVGVAGVIGGMASRVTEETVDVLLESAAFNAKTVRATRSSMGISTDASYRFERGSDRTACQSASDRACELIMKVAGGTPGQLVDAHPTPAQERTASIRESNTQRILGVGVGQDEIARFLKRLGFAIADTGENAVTVMVPSFRHDIVEEIDLIEEVARLYGYGRIGQGWKFHTTAHAEQNPFDDFIDAVSDHLVARGHTEIQTSTFTDGREVELFGWQRSDPRALPVRVQNPLTTQHACLRTHLLPGVLAVIQHNLDRSVRHVHVFHIGRVFLPARGDGVLPREVPTLLIAKSRPAAKDFWSDLKETTDLFDIKREIEVLLTRLRADMGGESTYQFDPATGLFSMDARGGQIVQGGVVSAAMAAAYGLQQPVWYASIDLRALYGCIPERPQYRKVPGFPSVRRDLSLVATGGVRYGEIEKCLVKNAGPLLESVQVFDVYQGDNIVGGDIAFGVRVNFRSPDTTLTDADVDVVLERVIAKLNKELGVSLRS